MNASRKHEETVLLSCFQGLRPRNCCSILEGRTAKESIYSSLICRAKRMEGTDLKSGRGLMCRAPLGRKVEAGRPAPARLKSGVEPKVPYYSAAAAERSLAPYRRCEKHQAACGVISHCKRFAALLDSAPGYKPAFQPERIDEADGAVEHVRVKVDAALVSERAAFRTLMLVHDRLMGFRFSVTNEELGVLQDFPTEALSNGFPAFVHHVFDVLGTILPTLLRHLGRDRAMSDDEVDAMFGRLEANHYH